MLLSHWHTVALKHNGGSCVRAKLSWSGWFQKKKKKEKEVRNQYLEVVEHPTPTPSCVTANSIAPWDRMLSNVTIDCCLR